MVANDETDEPIIQVLRNDTTVAGQLTLTAAEDLVVGAEPAFVISGDLDGDMADDLITVNEAVGAAEQSSSNSPPEGPSPGEVNALINRFCATDINNDGEVEVDDLIMLLDVFGEINDAADINDDGVVNVLDLIKLLLDFGRVCVP